MQNIKINTALIFSLLVFSLPIFAQKAPPSKSVIVYIFLSETCPICQSYTLTLKELYKEYKDKNVKFIGVFPNYYANLDSISVFKKKYAIPFDLVIDKNAQLTKRFGATITPEVFIEDEQHQVLYSGRIDDSFYSLGKRKKVITSNDLDDALHEISINQKIKLHKTQAVGCIISIS